MKAKDPLLTIGESTVEVGKASRRSFASQQSRCFSVRYNQLAFALQRNLTTQTTLGMGEASRRDNNRDVFQYGTLQRNFAPQTALVLITGHCLNIRWLVAETLGGYNRQLIMVLP